MSQVFRSKWEAKKHARKLKRETGVSHSIYRTDDGGYVVRSAVADLLAKKMNDHLDNIFLETANSFTQTASASAASAVALGDIYKAMERLRNVGKTPFAQLVAGPGTLDAIQATPPTGEVAKTFMGLSVAVNENIRDGKIYAINSSEFMKMPPIAFKYDDGTDVPKDAIGPIFSNFFPQHAIRSPFTFADCGGYGLHPVAPQPQQTPPVPPPKPNPMDKRPAREIE